MPNFFINDQLLCALSSKKKVFTDLFMLQAYQHIWDVTQIMFLDYITILTAICNNLSPANSVYVICVSGLRSTLHVITVNDIVIKIILCE